MNILGSSSRNIIIRFIADTAKASRDIDNLLNKTRKFQGAGRFSDSGPMGYMSGGFRGIFGNLESQAITKVTGLLGELGITGEAAFSALSLGAAAATAAVIGLGYAFKETFHYGNLVEGALIQMEQLTGSAKKARYEMREAMYYSIITPFRPAEVLGATAASLQYGIDPFKRGGYGLGKDQKAIDIFAGLGSMRDLQGNPLGIERMTQAVLRGDYRLLRPVRGVVGGAYDKAKATGFNVGTQGFNEKFIEELGKLPAVMNMAKAHSESMSGLWSTISGFAQDFWVAISGAGEEEGVLTFWSQIRSVLKDIRDVGIGFIEYVRPGLVEFGARIGSVFKFAWDILKSIGRIIAPVIIPMLKVWWQVQRAIGTVFVFILQTLAKIWTFLADFVGAISPVFEMITGFGASLQNTVNAFTEFVTGLQVTFQLLGIFIDYLLGKVIQLTENLRDAFVGKNGFAASLNKELEKISPKAMEKLNTLAEIGAKAGGVYKDVLMYGPGAAFTNETISGAIRDYLSDTVKTDGKGGVTINNFNITDSPTKKKALDSSGADK